MLKRSQKITLFFAFLLLISPASSFAYRYYGGYGGDWYYHGSGRDLPYSYVIAQTTPGYADYAYVAAPDYVEAAAYYNDTPLPSPQAGQFVVNIPNNHGSYTAVVIKRSGNGYTGPQGEFYPEFPKVSQLQIMYGK